jgi:hypothetical protein
MASVALEAFTLAVEEIDELQRADPTPVGRVSLDPARTRVVGRASVVLLSSHFERYVYAINEEAIGVVNASGVMGAQLPERLKLLHSRVAVDAVVATDWEQRGDKLRAFMASDSWLWADHPVGALDCDALLVWMKAPTPKNLVRYFRYWEIQDIFRSVTRADHTRTDLWLKLDELVRKRNNIAHGDPTTEATPGDIRSYREAALRFCSRSDGRLARSLARIIGAPLPW